MDRGGSSHEKIEEEKNCFRDYFCKTQYILRIQVEDSCVKLLTRGQHDDRYWPGTAQRVQRLFCSL